MKQPLFSIVVVALNPGDKLLNTVKSIAEQTCRDYEIIIKDGGSGDGSFEALEAYLQKETEFAARVRLYREPDKSIYDAMNQAVRYAKGEFYLFLNCGDNFHDSAVLAGLKKAIEEDGKAGERHEIYYGNIWDMLQDSAVFSNPHINAFACYRNIPCHQACFYAKSLFSERGYRTKYKVRGDYEHFLWCFFEKKASPRYVPLIIADYEGGGFSETKENIKRSKREHKEITALYMNRGQILYYQLLLCLSLAPLRTWLAHSKHFAGFYNKLKGLLYRKNKKD